MRGNVFSVYQHSNALADVDRSAETQHIDYHNDICPNREGVNGARPPLQPNPNHVSSYVRRIPERVQAQPNKKTLTDLAKR